MNVHRALAPISLKSICPWNMEIELGRLGIHFESEAKPNVFHEAQWVSCRVATGIDVGLPLNFGSPSLETKRQFRKLKSKQALN